MRLFRTLMLTLSLTFLTAPAFSATGAPPSDFRGIKWGSKPTKTMTKVGGPFGPEKLSVWKNAKHSLLPYFEIPIQEEGYLFENNLLYGGQLFTDGSKNFEAAREALIKNFGKPDFKNEKLKLFKWKWPVQKLEISLSYQDKFKRTTITIQKK